MKFLPLASLGIMAMAGFGAVSLKDQISATSVDKAGLMAHETHASASLLGQFRTNFSAWLWLRADLYLHNGVEMRMLSESEQKRGMKGVGNSEQGKDALHDDSIMVTVVPDKNRDFRGWVGDVERATKAYKDMKGHGHNDPEDSLPLFRLMTWIDPAFTPAWVTGATIMGRRQTDAGFNQAILFLKEGLAQNPNSVTILGELGRFYAGKKKNFARALPPLEKALELMESRESLTEDEAEGWLMALRWAALCYRETGQPAKQRQAAAKGLRVFPHDPVLSRMLGHPPFILTREAQADWLREALEKAEPEDEHDHDDDHHEEH